MVYDNDDYDPSRPNLALSQAELESLHDSFAQTIILQGEVRDFDGLYPVTPESPEPYVFEVPVDGRVAKGIFHPDDDELISAPGCFVHYHQPHRVNPLYEEPDGPVREGVMVRLNWQLAGTDITQTETYHLDKAQGLHDGYVATYFMRDGKRISPNNISWQANPTTDEILEFIEDINALERQLTVDDAEKLRMLAQVIGR